MESSRTKVCDAKWNSIHRSASIVVPRDVPPLHTQCKELHKHTHTKISINFLLLCSRRERKKRNCGKWRSETNLSGFFSLREHTHHTQNTMNDCTVYLAAGNSSSVMNLLSFRSSAIFIPFFLWLAIACHLHFDCYNYCKKSSLDAHLFLVLNTSIHLCISQILFKTIRAHFIFFFFFVGFIA